VSQPIGKLPRAPLTIVALRLSHSCYCYKFKRIDDPHH